MKLNSRHIILQKLSAAADKCFESNLVELDDSKIHRPIESSLDDCFAKELALISGGSFSFKTEEDLYAELDAFLKRKNIAHVYSFLPQLKHFLPNLVCNEEPYSKMEAAITECEFLVARTGSILVSSASYGGRELTVFPPIHIVVAKRSQLKAYVTDALIAVKEKYPDKLPSLLSIISGPSRTADIEKTLVMGAHGPRELYVFIAENL